MEKSNSKNKEVFGKVIQALASDAASNIEGVELCAVKRSKEPVSVQFLPNEKVTVTLYVTLSQNYPVPQAVAKLQENVKAQIEGTTKFKVHSVDVEVVGVRIDNV